MDRDEYKTDSLMPHKPTDSSIPMIRDQKTGLDTVDWDSLLVLDSTDRLVVDYLKIDLDPDLIATTGKQLLEMYDKGLLPHMRDVFEITQLAVERKPNMSMVEDQMTRNGYTSETVGILWDTRDSLDISVDQTHTIFSELGFDLSDEKDIEMIDAALDAIQAARGVYRHTAADMIVEGIKGGFSLKQMIDGETL